MYALADAATIATWRNAVAGTTAGTQVWAGPGIPLRDNLADAVIVAGPLPGVDQAELIRVLAYGGTAFVAEGPRWTTVNAPVPVGLGRRTDHQDTPRLVGGVADDSLVVPPFALRWWDGPAMATEYPRPAQGDGVIGVVADGGITAVLTDVERPDPWAQVPAGRTLVVRNVANGVRLWTRAAPKGIAVAMGGGRIFLLDNAGVTALSADTGTEVWSRPLPTRRGTRPIAWTPSAVVVGGLNQIEQFACAEGTPLGKQVDISDWTSVDDSVISIAMNGAVTRWQAGKPVWTSTPDPALALPAKTFSSNIRVSGVVGDLVGVTGGTPVILRTFNLADGKPRWTATAPPSQDAKSHFIRNPIFPWGGGVAWATQVFDPATGAARGQAPEASGSRCTNGTVTPRFVSDGRGNYLLPGATKPVYEHGLRGGCWAGLAIAQGRLLAVPTVCSCVNYILPGWSGLAAQQAPRPGGQERETGQAKAQGQPPAATDWPEHRRSGTRGAASPVAVPADLTLRWSATVAATVATPLAEQWRMRAPRLTPPVVAGGQVVVADGDGHQVIALSLADGTERWRYTLSARIDSAPTLVGGACIFGGRDGAVTALDGSSGGLIWRVRVAPAEDLVVSAGQVESAWPVPGAVLMVGGLVHAVAGRTGGIDNSAASTIPTTKHGGNTIITSGMAYAAIDLASGEVKRRTAVGGRNDLPILGEGSLLLGGGSLLLGEGTAVDLSTGTNQRLRKFPSPSRPLERGHPAAGLIDGMRTQRGIAQPWVAAWDDAGKDGGAVFAGQLDPTRQLAQDTSSRLAETWVRLVDDDGKLRWSQELPKDSLPTAIILAGDAVVVAGGTKATGTAPASAWIQVRARGDGRLRQTVPLPDLTVPDGLAVVPGALVATTRDGRVLCLGR
ncbi:hypothetical protein LBMAG53_09150 [Planctomycetota bacterium]|nr:hypothetical protein LBMAG53_09150 [Planctomycetota bacterium]